MAAPTTPCGRERSPAAQAALYSVLPSLSLFSPAREHSSISRGGAPLCAIDGAAELAVPTTGARLDPPIASP